MLRSRGLSGDPDVPQGASAQRLLDLRGTDRPAREHVGKIVLPPTHAGGREGQSRTMSNPEEKDHPQFLVVGSDGEAVPGNPPEEEGGEQERSVAEMVEQPAKVMRIGSMIRQLLEEVRAAPLDENSRARLKEIHHRSIKELEQGLSPELVDELERLALPFTTTAPQRSRAAGRAGPAGRLAGGPLPRDPDRVVRPADGGPGAAGADAPRAAARDDAGPAGPKERPQQAPGLGPAPVGVLLSERTAACALRGDSRPAGRDGPPPARLR